jgi:hypothetical protein
MFKYRQEFKDKEMDYKIIPSGISKEGFQSLLKQRILRRDMKEFFNKKINETNILEYTKLLEENFYTKDIVVEDEKAVQELKIENRKYLLDLTMIALYEEAISIEEVFSLEDTKTIDELIDIFEQIAFLELGLFTIDLSDIDPVPKSKYYNKIYITDNIKLLSFGETYRASYESIQNIYNEVSVLYNDSNSILEAADKTYLTDLGFFDNSLYPSVTTENSVSSLTKVNRFPANIEGNKISIFSFLMNYITTEDSGTVYNENMLRKFYAISVNGSNTRGSYKKIEDGIIVTKYFDGLDGISYYDTLKTIFSNETQFKRINEFLHTFWNFILERTINY